MHSFIAYLLSSYKRITLPSVEQTINMQQKDVEVIDRSALQWIYYIEYDINLELYMYLKVTQYFVENQT